MRAELPWKSSAGAYVDLYEKAKEQTRNLTKNN
jgi:hypothetical protein